MRPLRIFPFGGVGEFGKNMMLYALGDEGIFVDCGIGFPEPGQHGVDVVIPDLQALDRLNIKVRAVVLTHGHEDHIGAVPYHLPQLNCPVFGTPITLGLLQGKLAECGVQGDLQPLLEGKVQRIGPFEIEAIPVTHSIMDAVSLALHTPYGIVVHTGDFRIDPAPLDGRATALHRFAALGNEGVVLLVSDSTNATRGGSGPSERSVGPALRQAIADCNGMVVVTTFASNMFRIQQILDVAQAFGRSVYLAGRSLERNVHITRQLGRLSVKPGLIVDLHEASQLDAHRLLVIATGSQGEARAAMARLAQGQMKGIKLKEGDLVIFSSSMIPGNEKAITALINHVYRRGARVMHVGKDPRLHVSGHAQAHELKIMMQLVRPKYFYPVHGEYRNLVEHKHLALAMGIDEKNILIAENGQSLILDEKGLGYGPQFHAGAIFVDGENREEIDDLVLRDRRMLAKEGIVVAIAVIERQEGRVTEEPEILARGVMHQEIGSAALKKAAAELKLHLLQTEKEVLADEDAVKEEIRIFLRRWFKRHHGRRPMVLPVVLEV